MKISCCWLYAISKYGYPPSIKNTYTVLEEMKKLGFDYAELEGVREKNMRDVYKNRQKIKQHCDGLGIKIINFCPILPDSVSLEKKKRKKSWELFDMGLELADYFKAPTIQLDSFTPPLKFKGAAPYKESVSHGIQFSIQIDPKFRWKRQWDALVETIQVCGERAKAANKKLLMEPRVGELISNTDALLRLMDHAGCDNFYAVLDTGHQNAQKELLPLSVEKLGKKIKYLHVSDNDSKTNEHLRLGEGTIDWDSVFKALKKHKFNGYVAIDIGHTKDLDGDYIESKKYLENLARKLKM